MVKRCGRHSRLDASAAVHDVFVELTFEYILFLEQQTQVVIVGLLCFEFIWMVFLGMLLHLFLIFDNKLNTYAFILLFMDRRQLYEFLIVFNNLV